jgi:hypothetical protein
MQRGVIATTSELHPACQPQRQPSLMNKSKG